MDKNQCPEVTVTFKRQIINQFILKCNWTFEPHSKEIPSLDLIPPTAAISAHTLRNLRQVFMVISLIVRRVAVT